MKKYILAIDQGTTGTTLLLIDREGHVTHRHYQEIKQYYPQPAWVEHDAEEIWNSVESGMEAILRESGVGHGDLDSIGITNQRETTVVWDSRSGKPVHHAIVWQCRRTAAYCEELKQQGHEDMIREKTGLVLDAYFSATKLKWLLDACDPDRSRSRKGELKFGTIDSWIMYRMSGGRVHLTDPTNASRTMLYNIESKSWDPELLELFTIPREILPEVQDSSGLFFMAGPEQNIPVTGVAGDQQAALFGHGAWDSGTIKNTYGTGCFMMINTGAERIHSQNGLLTTLACDARGKAVYALEASIFIAGAVIQYLRDELGLLHTAAESEEVARSIDDTGGVYFVPAFVGLGAPWWDMNARGCLSGLTRGSGRAHIVRAALESIAYQSADVFQLMLSESSLRPAALKTDGGASSNTFLMQFQADLLGLPVEKNAVDDLTALGAAGLAGIHSGFWTSARDFAERTRSAITYEPDKRNEKQMKNLYRGWTLAVRRVLS